MFGGGLFGGGRLLVLALLAVVLPARSRGLASLRGRLLRVAELLLRIFAGLDAVLARRVGLRLGGLDLGGLRGQRELLRLLGRVEGRGVEAGRFDELELGDLQRICRTSSSAREKVSLLGGGSAIG